MRIGKRMIVAVVLLSTALIGEWLLDAHLASAPLPPAGRLAKPLAELPTRLGAWQGEDATIDPRMLFADQHLYRRYRQLDSNREVMLWMVFSSNSIDRQHHPEICMEVAGMREDVASRALVEIPGGLPVQQFRFVGLRGQQWVYYWHYTLPTQVAPSLSAVQQLYQRQRFQPASVTVEVFSTLHNQAGIDAVQSFVAGVDAALREHVGPTAIRGNQRTPVLNEEAL